MAFRKDLRSIFNLALKMTIAGATIIATAKAQAFSSPATVDKKSANEDRCTIRSPQENNRPPSLDGMTSDELVQLAQVSGSDAEWVKYYVGGKEHFDQLMKTGSMSIAPNTAPGARIPLNAQRQNNVQGGRIASWGKCADIQKFVEVVNRDLYMTPKMFCSSGNVGFTFTISNNMVVMEMSQLVTAPAMIVPPAVIPGQQTPGGAQSLLPGLMVASQQSQIQVIPGEVTKRSLSREPVKLDVTNKSDCPMKVTEINGSGLNLQLCLPLKPKNETGEGHVAMTLYGNDSTGDLACDADASYLNLMSGFHNSGLRPPLPGGQPSIPTQNSSAPAGQPAVQSVQPVQSVQSVQQQISR